MSQGLLLFGHGARDAAWADPFRAVADRIAADHPGLAIELAFLDFIAPDLQTAAERLAARGCTQVRVVPMFLGTGGHVRRDLPQLLLQLQQRHPQVRWTLAAAIGEQPAVIAAMAAAASEGI
ncbi:MAG: CbiX/SirB N-terminal domain-containing protein [Burkholderiaceae bacterium]